MDDIPFSPQKQAKIPKNDPIPTGWRASDDEIDPSWLGDDGDIAPTADEKPAIDDDSPTAEKQRKSPEYEPFPLTDLPDVMAIFAAEIERSLSVDPSAAILPMLSVAGASIGNALRARMTSDWLAPPNIWTAIVARSGERKSPILRAVAKPIHEAQSLAHDEYLAAMAEYERDNERRKSKPKSDRGDEPTAPQMQHIYMSDATVEAIGDRLGNSPRGLLVMVDELAALFNSFNQYKSGQGNDREAYLNFYEAGYVKIDRKVTKPPFIIAPRAFVTVTGGVQNKILSRCLGDGEFESGLAARFIFCAPPARKVRWTDQGVDEGIKRAWRNCIIGLLDIPCPNEPRLIKPTNAAMSLFASAHDRLEDDLYSERDDRMRAARSKLTGAIPRIALILQAVSFVTGEKNSSIEEIDQLSMQRAISIVDWAIGETKRVYSSIDEDAIDRAENDGNTDDWIYRRIEENGMTCTSRDLMHWSRRFRGSSKYATEYLDSLVKDGSGRWEPSVTGGRPMKIFHALWGGGNGNKSQSDAANGGFVTGHQKNGSPKKGGGR